MNTSSKDVGGKADNSEWRNLYDLEEPPSTDVSPPDDPCGFLPRQGISDEKDNLDGKEDLKNRDGVKALPFEFIALEAYLEATCSSLDSEVRDELEHLLDDDDDDMAEMYLTEKLAEQKLDESSVDEHDYVGGRI